MTPPDDSSLSPAEDLISAAEGSPAEQPGGSLRTALANAMVGLKKGYYGRGPTAAKAWILDDYVFVALEGGLTKNEDTLLDAGKHDLVRSYRLAFQETMTEKTCGAVEELTGRKVLSYHSQIIFRPTRSFEIFLLEPEGS
ncbi:MAG TPA: Na-translocating system protein MpsC family protein [Solirubrobacteraceae bacterium]|nr:Na-translocating system protein MpsC family protein [Solirubrobacteraceae bacterium]